LEKWRAEEEERHKGSLTKQKKFNFLRTGREPRFGAEAVTDACADLPLHEFLWLAKMTLLGTNKPQALQLFHTCLWGQEK
jgi:hypothetical protein